VILDFKLEILRGKLELLEGILGVPYMGEIPLMDYITKCVNPSEIVNAWAKYGGKPRKCFKSPLRTFTSIAKRHTPPFK
jgi:hypothetical protein